MQECQSTFDDLRAQVDVVVVLHEYVKARGSDVELDKVYYEVFTVREGKVSRMQWFDDRLDAMEG